MAIGKGSHELEHGKADRRKERQTIAKIRLNFVTFSENCLKL